MPPRWGLEWFLGVVFYKDVAPLALGNRTHAGEFEWTERKGAGQVDVDAMA